MLRIMTRRLAFDKAIASSVVGLSLAIFMAAEGRTAPSSEELASREWWVHRAAQGAGNIEDSTIRSEAFYKLSYAQGRIGELESASRSAAEVNNIQTAIYATTFVAKQYFRQGDTTGAASLLHLAQRRAQASPEATNNFVFGHLIREYVEMDMADDAIAYAETLPGPTARDLGLRDVAAAAAQHGDLSLALAVVDDRLSEPWKPSGLLAVGDGSAAGGHVADVETIAEKLGNAADRDRVYAALVSTLVEKDRVEEANEIAGRIESATVQDVARSRILAGQAKAEDIAELRATLARLQSREEKLAASKTLVERLTADKKVAEADEAIAAMVKSIEAEPREEVSSKFGQFGDDSAIAAVKAQYLPIAEVLAEQGDLAEAKRHVQMAADAVTALPESAGLVKWPQIAGVVMTQIKIGDLAGARTTLAKVPASGGQSFAAAKLAAALADAGDVSAAVEVARQITAGTGFGSSLGMAAAAIYRAGEVDAATKLLEGIDDLSERARAYHVAGRTMIEAGGGKQLAAWIDANHSDLARTFACLGAAEALSQENIK